MADIHFELEEDATRKRIFATLISSLPNDAERGKVGRIVGDNSIRMEQQLHNVAEIEQALELTVADSFAKENTLAIYRILAKAEAQAHGGGVVRAGEETEIEILGFIALVGVFEIVHQFLPSRFRFSMLRRVGRGNERRVFAH